MFSIGVSEVILVVVVGCLVTDPRKLPGMLKTAGRYYRKFEEMRAEVLDSFREACKGESAKSDAYKTTREAGTRQIVGDDGTVYESYEVSELVKVEHQNKLIAETIDNVRGSREKE